MPPALVFFFKIALAIWGLLWFHTNFRIVCSSSVKSAGVIQIGIALDVQIDLGSINIVKIFVFLIHEHGIFFHFFVSSSISSISFLQFSVQRSFTSLVGFIPRCFMVLGEIVNGISFCISLSVASLLAYKNAANFCTLILYPVTLLNSCRGESRQQPFTSAATISYSTYLQRQGN